MCGIAEKKVPLIIKVTFVKSFNSLIEISSWKEVQELRNNEKDFL